MSQSGTPLRGTTGPDAFGAPPPYRGAQLKEIAFPLGGIGTGMISLGGWGQLGSWEVQNRPAKGAVMPHAFFAVRARKGRHWSAARVLQGPPMGRRAAGGHSAPRHSGEGLPHFANVLFHGEFPIARVVLTDPEWPIRVTLEAFNPFIPLDPDDSGIPAAILLYHFENESRSTFDLTVAGNLTNFIGPREGRVNEARSTETLTGLALGHGALPADSPEFGSIVLATPVDGAKVWPRWPAGWNDWLNDFWEAFAEGKVFPPRAGSARPGNGRVTDTGSLAVSVRLRPAGTITVPFVIAWHFPTVAHWRTPPGGAAPPTWRNHYASTWSDAWDVARYTAENLERLRAETEAFHDTLFASTVPAPVLDAVSSQLSTVKTPTCLRLPDGTFYGFEGTSDTAGCCEGSCTHVWNYAQALPYLFPSLQRSMHEASFARAMAGDGWVTFRLPLPPGSRAEADYHPAADGQMGQVIQVYREWRLSGDTAWLARMWPPVKKALEFAWKYWDANRDGVMEGMQHNTYDVEFYGPNPLVEGLYLCALRAAEEMARALGHRDDARRYRGLFEKGARWTDRNLFNGHYYEQKVAPKAHLAWPEPQRRLAEAHGQDGRFRWPRWQCGTGCLADQLMGEWYAAMLGLGPLLKPANVRKALQSIFKHNWRASLVGHAGRFRLYALEEEPGLIVCTWPRGNRPGHPVPYADEVWCGQEYLLASHLIYAGFVAEGLAVATGVRQRYTGEHRNPWDEFECGHHYARSMASYALLLALSGFRYSAPDQRIEFDPRLTPERFRTFFCVPSGWGLFAQRADGRRCDLTLEVRYGSLTLRQLTTSAATAAGTLSASLDRQPLAPAAVAVRTGLAIVFADPVTITADETLRITIETP